MEILKIKLEEQLTITYRVINCLILLKIRNMMDINAHFLLIKRPSGVGIKNGNISNKELAEELYKPIIKKFQNENYTHLL